MAATATEFPPHTYSTTFFSRNVLKDIISKREKKNKSDSSKEAAAAGKPPKGWRKSTKNNPSHNSSHADQANNKPGSANSEEEDMTLLKYLALNALELGSPASGLPLKYSSNESSGWLQLSGHPDSFAIAGPGTIWKKTTLEDGEIRVYEALQQLKTDSSSSIVPKFYRKVEFKNELFIELEDLLSNFNDPYVMDIKMGTRTFLESEVSRTNARPDLYQKMVRVDSNAPTPEEHKAQAVTKLRYMRFREQQSSTSTLGFRIEAMKVKGCDPVRELQKVCSQRDVQTVLALFLHGKEQNRINLLKRLIKIRTAFEESNFFKYNEVVGSSLLLVREGSKVGAWLIDFAKARPSDIPLDHRSPWCEGNHEDGFLFGLDTLIKTVQQCDLKVMQSSRLEKFLRSLPWK
ncbi:inositol-trisphosphate 3-kinase homolog isoform X2 [Neocloeon triangulifer]|nr:inositol-trisphosphate 3-kinase homolog isoform X2 [Neocloeon triangulifer]